MFSSFSEIITLIFLGFAFVYPFFLWIAPLKTIDKGFYRFNLGMCCIVGAIGGTTFHFLNPDFVSEIYLWVWFGAIMSITAIYWNSNHINNIVITDKYLRKSSEALWLFNKETEFSLHVIACPESKM